MYERFIPAYHNLKLNDLESPQRGRDGFVTGRSDVLNEKSPNSCYIGPKGANIWYFGNFIKLFDFGQRQL